MPYAEFRHTKCNMAGAARLRESLATGATAHRRDRTLAPRPPRDGEDWDVAAAAFAVHDRGQNRIREPLQCRNASSASTSAAKSARRSKRLDLVCARLLKESGWG